MTRLRLTIRARLALLCTGLFAACAAIVVAITYALVAHLPLAGSSASTLSPRAAYVISCRDDLKKADLDPERRAQCEESVRVLGDAFSDGVDQGAQRQRDQTLTNLLWYSLGALGAVTVLAALAGWFVAGRVLRPIHQITAAARTASEHNLSARVALTGPRDELRELANTFDEMLARLEAAFEGQRRFIANASHELRTPLTVMRASVDVVLAKPAPTAEELRDMGRDVRAAVDQAQSLIDALLTLARNEYGLTVHEPVDLATVAEDVLDSSEPGDRHRQVSLRPAPTSGDPVLLERLVANLVDNATRYNVPGGDLRLSTSTVDGQAVLVVTNTGPVVAPDTVDGLFEPFRRLHDRTGGDGFGLGLAIVASIATVHRGTVAARPVPGGGLEVTLTLPSNEAG